MPCHVVVLYNVEEKRISHATENPGQIRLERDVLPDPMRKRPTIQDQIKPMLHPCRIRYGLNECGGVKRVGCST